MESGLVKHKNEKSVGLCFEHPLAHENYPDEVPEGRVVTTSQLRVRGRWEIFSQLFFFKLAPTASCTHGLGGIIEFGS